jgi:hypothetical protein
MLPKARHDKLTVRDLSDETLVYDLDRQKAHCLNPTAALVWRHCDGRTNLAQLADIVRKELGIGKADAVARLALEQLSRRHLLEEPLPPLVGAARISRRRVLKKLALAAVVLPLVMTVSGASSGVNASGFWKFRGRVCSLHPISVNQTALECGALQCIASPDIDRDTGLGRCA